MGLIKNTLEQVDDFMRHDTGDQMSKQLKSNIAKSITLIGFMVIGFIFVIVMLFGGMYRINERQEAVVYKFGKYDTTVSEAGIHFKTPFADKVIKVPTTIQSTTFGYRIDEEGNEVTTNDSEMITSDFNFVNVDFFVEYKVSDSFKYVTTASDPDFVLQNILVSSVRSTVNTYTVDEVLTLAKDEIQSKVKDSVNAELNEQNIGLTLTQVTLQDSEPPTAEVKAAFDEVENARQKKSTLLNEAQAYSNKRLPDAQTKADSLVKEAEAYKQARINEANGATESFNNIYAEYVNNPQIVLERLYLDGVQEAIKNTNKIINTTDSTNVILSPDGKVSVPAATATTEGK